MAIPAYPRKVKFVQGNDTIWLTLRGDEYVKYAIDEDGYTAIHDSLGWYYAYKDEKGDVKKSSFRVQSNGKMSMETKSFLATQPKGLCPSISIDNLRQLSPHFDNRRNSPVVGERRALIILMQYSDVKMQKTQNDFDRLFNEQGYQDDGAYGSVYDYYDKVSYGQLQLKCDVLGPYTSSRNMSYYGSNSSRTGGDTNPKALFDEAIRFAIQEVNLQDYDSDNDGYVDNVHIIFAGYGEEAGASANAIWSHEMTFRPESIGGMLIDHYSCSPELRGNSGNGISRIGAPCHEIGHALGAMDFYDVDYQAGGYYEGTGDWDIMASGSWNDDGARPADFNPYVKAYNYGWVDVKALTQDSINIICPSTTKDNIYRIETPVNGDYFLLDNRQSEGITSAEPGKGLLIFHIGPAIEQKAQSNTINSTYPQHCYIVCASSTSAKPNASASSFGNINSSGCPYPGTSHNTSFTKSSIPAALTINGYDANIFLTTITQMANGDISLIYGKSNVNDDTPPDEPTIDDDIKGEIIWNDDFEIANHFLSQTWSQYKIVGNGSWIVKLYFTNPSDKEPEKANGNRYLALESETDETIHGSESRYSSKIVSGAINLSPGSYNLSGMYAGYAISKMPTDTLHIELLSDNVGNWSTAKSLRIINQNRWNSFNIPINCTESDVIRIAFTGSASESSLLFVDNLILYKSEDSSEVQIAETDRELTHIYCLDGIYLGEYKMIYQTLKRGIYISRRGNTIRKIYVSK